MQSVTHYIDSAHRDRWEIEREAFAREQAMITREPARPFLFYERARISHEPFSPRAATRKE